MRPSLLAACLSATLLVASLPAYASGADPDAATPVQREQAQARFDRGRQLFADKKFREALAEFEGSHDIVSSPNARLYMAYCRRELGELVVAYEEFGRAATEAREHARGDPRYTKAAESAERERQALAPRLGFVTVVVQNATPDTKLALAGEEIKRAAWSEAAPVLPGSTEIVAETPGRPATRVSVTVAAGERKSATIEVGPAPPPPPAAAIAPPPPPVDDGPRQPLRTIAYVTGGVGVAGLAGFAVFGSMAKSTYGSLQSECPRGCTSDHASEVSSGKTQQTVANVALVVGIAGVATGVTLFVISRPTPRSDAPAAAVVAGPGWLGMRGTF